MHQCKRSYLIDYLELNNLPLNAAQAGVIAQYQLSGPDCTTRTVLPCKDTRGKTQIDAGDGKQFTSTAYIGERTETFTLGSRSIVQQQDELALRNRNERSDLGELTKQDSPLQMEARDVQFHPGGMFVVPHRKVTVSWDCSFIIHI